MTPESSFERLSKINVNERIEKKNGLSYLSWAWALDQLMRADPDATWFYGEPKTHGGGTVMVYCTVTAFGKQRTAHLPVMDYKNRAIPEPNAFEVNTAMQRCFVKAIAMHGLGLYIYAGEDVPNGETENTQPDTRNPLNAMKEDAFNLLPKDEQEFLRKVAADATALVGEDREDDAHGYLENQRLDTEEKLALWHLLDSKTRAALKRAGGRAEQVARASERNKHQQSRPEQRIPS
jgi:hypothetical protein